MFNDVLTSSKGPGVIGMLLAILVLGGFSGLGLMVLNSDGAVEIPIEDQIKEQLTRLDEIAVDISDERNSLQMYRERQDKLATKPIYEKRLARQIKAGADQQKEVEAVAVEIDSLGEEWEDYKASYRKNERARIKGKVLDLSETLGKGFEKVKVTGANPIELRLMLSTGPRGIPYEKLPLDLQDLLQFDAEEAAAYKGVIAQVEKAKGENIAKHNKAQAEMNAIRKAEEKVKTMARLRREIQNEKRKAEEKRAEAMRQDNIAVQEQAAVNRAKAAGRMTMRQSKVTEARSRASNARNAAKRHDQNAFSKQAELDNMGR